MLIVYGLRQADAVASMIVGQQLHKGVLVQICDTIMRIVNSFDCIDKQLPSKLQLTLRCTFSVSCSHTRSHSGMSAMAPLLCSGLHSDPPEGGPANGGPGFAGPILHRPGAVQRSPPSAGTDQLPTKTPSHHRNAGALSTRVVLKRPTVQLRSL